MVTLFMPACQIIPTMCQCYVWTLALQVIWGFMLLGPQLPSPCFPQPSKGHPNPHGFPSFSLNVCGSLSSLFLVADLESMILLPHPLHHLCTSVHIITVSMILSLQLFLLFYNLFFENSIHVSRVSRSYLHSPLSWLSPNTSPP